MPRRFYTLAALLALPAAPMAADYSGPLFDAHLHNNCWPS